jgi:alpha-L-fucosidase
MKTPLRFCLGSLLVALATSAFTQTPTPAYSATISERPVVKPYDAAQQARMKWFNDARLGMFIHWGLYAAPAGQWPGRPSTSRAEWIMQEEAIPSADYEKLAPQFNPEKFDAKAWVAVAQAAGMKYLVITAKHHDGFSMYDSKSSAYNIAAATPFRRDPLKELAAACREAGIVFCVYYSIADWHHPDSPAEYSQRRSDPVTGKSDPSRGFHGDPRPGADVRKYAAYMRDQVRELLTNYGPIGIVWFDNGGAFHFDGWAQVIEADQMAALIHRLQPEALINNRLGFDADYGTPEQRIPGRKTVEPFEVCMTLNDHWGFNRFDKKWKSPATVVRNIADIVSKGGNYLLNVGPTAEGEIPAEGIAILKEVGAWTSLNAAAIYGAGPTPFGDELGYEDATTKDRAGKPAWINRNDWRCTTQPGRLFFTLIKWPGGSFALPQFANRITRAYLLSDPSHAALKIANRRVALPATAPAALAPVLCVEVQGAIAPQAATGSLEVKKDKSS